MAALFPSPMSSMPTSSAWSMTKANFLGIVCLRLSTTGTTRIGTFIFVNWVKVSSFLALTDEDSFERGARLELVMTGKLRPTDSESSPPR